MVDEDQSFGAGVHYTFLNPSQTLTILKPIFNPSVNRSTTFLVLLAWLFTLISGLANACSPEIGASYHQGALVAHSSETVATSRISSEHGEALADHVIGSGASKVSCLQVFDDTSQALPQQRSAFDLSDSGLAPLIALVWNAAAASVVSAPNRVGALQPPAPRQPIRVRFSRLAL